MMVESATGESSSVNSPTDLMIDDTENDDIQSPKCSPHHDRGGIAMHGNRARAGHNFEIVQRGNGTFMLCVPCNKLIAVDNPLSWKEHQSSKRHFKKFSKLSFEALSISPSSSESDLPVEAFRTIEDLPSTLPLITEWNNRVSHDDLEKTSRVASSGTSYFNVEPLFGAQQANNREAAVIPCQLKSTLTLGLASSSCSWEFVEDSATFNSLSSVEPGRSKSLKHLLPDFLSEDNAESGKLIKRKLLDGRNELLAKRLCLESDGDRMSSFNYFSSRLLEVMVSAEELERASMASYLKDMATRLNPDVA